jgi:hypothetical protein
MGARTMPQGGGVPKDPERIQARTARAVAVKLHGVDSPQAREAKGRLEALKFADHAAAIVASWPELSGERLDRVAALLRAGGRQ